MSLLDNVLTWISHFLGLSVPAIVPDINFRPLPKLRAESAWFDVNEGHTKERGSIELLQT